MSKIQSLNPATGQVERVFQSLSHAEIDLQLERAVQAYHDYRKNHFLDRIRWMLEAARILDIRSEFFGKIISTEMGKPLHSAVEEVKKCAWNCRYFAENGPKFLKEEEIAAFPSLGIIRFDPLGPLLAIMPWNFPFWQVFRFAAPALIAGNVILLKHAANVPQCALQIEGVFREAGFPMDVFQTLMITSDQVGPLIGDDRIAAVTLTGSVEAGSAVAQASGKMIKKMVLELGGSDPFIVMPSADLDKAVQVAVESRMMNSGQSCVAAKRFILAEAIADEFEHKMIQAMKALRVGSPLDAKTQLGPLATEEVLLRLHQQVTASVEMGANLVLGGKRLEMPGFYYAPTLLNEVPKGCPAYAEELFGPVASLFRVEDARHALSIANDTQFGLGSSIWTRDEKEIDFFSEEIQAGNVFINQKVVSDPRLPFGGIKRSGYGRELGVWGIREFVNIKTVSKVSKRIESPIPGQPDSGELE